MTCGGVLGLDIEGRAFNEDSAAEDADDSVRKRSFAPPRTVLYLKVDDSAGRVATDWDEEIDDLRPEGLN